MICNKHIDASTNWLQNWGMIYFFKFRKFKEIILEKNLILQIYVKLIILTTKNKNINDLQ